MPRLFTTEIQRHRKRDKEKFCFTTVTREGTELNLRRLLSLLSLFSGVRPFFYPAGAWEWQLCF